LNVVMNRSPKAGLVPDATNASLTATLQQARKVKRISQLELSLRMGVSQRHVSFVESGRAKPSRDLLISWLAQLEAPLVMRNAAMLQAGFAPAYSEAALDDPALTQARDALVHLLETHDPMPALVIDADWRVVLMNKGAQWLTLTLVPRLIQILGSGPISLLDMLNHPEGLLPVLLNAQEAGSVFLAELRDDAVLNPKLAPQVELFAGRLRKRLGAKQLASVWPRGSTPMLTLRFASPFGELAFFRMFSTFGSPQDITLSSLRVEHMFAADEHTKLVLREQVLNACLD
jgi:transcriptional regulator with XRE-family HTH domain